MNKVGSPFSCQKNRILDKIRQVRPGILEIIPWLLSLFSNFRTGSLSLPHGDIVFVKDRPFGLFTAN